MFADVIGRLRYRLLESSPIFPTVHMFKGDVMNPGGSKDPASRDSFSQDETVDGV